MVTRFTLVANEFLKKLKKVDKKIQNFDLLAKQVLDKKVRGYFVLRNGEKISSDYLRLCTFDFIKYPYFLKCHAYTEDGTFWEDRAESSFDIVEFIQENEEKKEKDMDTSETRNVTLTLDKAREWYQQGGELREVALQAFDEKDLMVNGLPTSWLGYTKLNTGFDGTGISWQDDGLTTTGLHHRGDAIVPTKYGAPMKQFIRLINLRHEWIKDWEPDWSNDEDDKFCVVYRGNELCVGMFKTLKMALSFPTKEMANDFLSYFRKELEIAKDLI